ncbi:MAG: AAA family ATPase [Planctomycetes bacterium]|nr:AAA family ATPase [Planctomycetota bacterium]
MRILAIRGQNLASLARTFSVELAAGELADAGLFAICGPVGAGKSTLLDALCLALFDRTPRLSGRGGTLIGDDGQDENDWLRANDPRTLLRRNAIEGHAEADFVGRDGVTYRARWSVRRARRRPDGRLQEQEMSLTDVRQDLVVAGGRRTEVLAAIRQRLGLDFGQFCRSVLLAQGEFHAFLHAPARERAKLLETLTGAQIYRRLSRAAHDKRVEHDRHVARLRGQLEQVGVLEDDARQQLERDVERLEKQVEICDLGIKVAHRYVSWHQDAERHREAEDRASLELRKAIEQHEAAAHRRAQLQARQRAMAAVPRFEVAEQARARAAAAVELVRSRVAAQRAAEQRAQQAEQGLAAEAQRRFGAVASMPPLVRELSQWQPALQRWHDHERRLATALQRLPQLERDAERAAAKAAEVRREEQALRAAITAANTALEQAERLLAEADYDQLAERRRSLTEQRERDGLTEASLQRWREAQAASEQAERAFAAAARALAEREPDRGTTARALATCAERVAELRRRLRAAEQAHGLEALRAQLQDGEACPLCGSHEHPAKSHELPDVEHVRRELEQAEQAHDEARRAAAHAASEWQRLTAERDRLAELRDRAAAALAEQRAPFAEHDTIAAATAELEARRVAWREQDRQLAAVEADARQRAKAVRDARQRRSEAEQAVDAWRRRVAAADAVLQQQRDAQRDVERQVERLRDTLAELRHGLVPACAGLPDGVASVEALGSDRLEVLRGLHQSHREHAESLASVATAVEACTKAQEREREQLAERAAADEALTAALRANDVTEDDVAIARRLGSEALLAEADALRQLEDDVQRCRHELGIRSKLRREHEDQERPTLDADDALRALDDARKDRERVRKLFADAHAKLAYDETMRKRRAELMPGLQRAERELDTWRALADLIGSSAGDAFAVFAQALTLDLLLLEANRRLEELARRYRLEKSQAGDLDFVVVDLDLGGTRRSLQTLSGGETFLVSLALALALATLAAPRSRVETLFLDEGFGTLDAHNLEIALGALDSLQATGCQVGIISHVEGIAERIGAVVEVRPEGSGQSRVVARRG